MLTGETVVLGGDYDGVLEHGPNRAFREQLMQMDEKLDKLLSLASKWPLPQECTDRKASKTSTDRKASKTKHSGGDDCHKPVRQDSEPTDPPISDLEEAEIETAPPQPEEDEDKPDPMYVDSTTPNQLRRKSTLIGLKELADGESHAESLRAKLKHASLLERSSLLSRMVVRHAYFERIMGVIIICNCVSIGVNTQLALDEEESDTLAKVELVETTFFFIYIVELALRLMADSWRAFRDLWVRFDLLLVILGLVDQFSGALKQIMFLRLFRIMRLLKALRMMQHFRPLWQLVYGFATSINAIFSMLLLLLLVFFMFACLGIDIITKDANLMKDPQLSVLIDRSFSSVPLFMLTLLQFATVDSVSGIYFDLIVAKPALVFYFVPLVLIVSITMMNLITAVIVENALASAAADKAFLQQEQTKKIKGLSPMIHQVFKQIDSNGSGNITIEEMSQYDINLLPEVFLEYVEPESMVELFEMLDVDGSNEICEEEFVLGVLQMCLAEVPIEVMQVLKLVRLVWIQSAKIERLTLTLTERPGQFHERKGLKKRAEGIDERSDLEDNSIRFNV